MDRSAEPAADIQRALTALTRRASRIHVDPGEHLVLAELHLAGAYLRGADLTRAHLYEADLTGAYLGRADLTAASLYGADLREARGLTPQQAEGAHLGEKTRLPVGLVIPGVPAAG